MPLSIPRWFLALASIALLSISAWAIRETVRPQESWIVLNQIGVDADTGIPAMWVLLEQHSGTWCMVPFGGESPKLDAKAPVLSPKDFDKARNESAASVCRKIR
jgi:hypothetical protein